MKRTLLLLGLSGVLASCGGRADINVYLEEGALGGAGNGSGGGRLASGGRAIGGVPATGGSMPYPTGGTPATGGGATTGATGGWPLGGRTGTGGVTAGGTSGTGGRLPTGGIGGTGGVGGHAPFGGTGGPGGFGPGGEAGAAGWPAGGGGEGGAASCPDGYVGEDCEQCVVFVTTSGSDANSGGSWDRALATVQAGLDLAASRLSLPESVCEVWVASGTYFPTVDAYGNADGAEPRRKSLFLRANVGLFGGFVGTEFARDQRTSTEWLTTLSGDLGVSGDDLDNAFHVLVGATGAAIDGFEIVRGRAHGSTFPDDRGGGMLNVDASPAVANCHFTDNEAMVGGGIYNEGVASPTVLDCTLENNFAAFGGGMYNLNAAPYVSNTVFAENTADQGGGMYNEDASVRLSAASFFANFAAVGGGIANMGGSLDAQSCTITGQVAEELGAGMYNKGASVVLTGCHLTGLQAERGAALASVESSLTIYSTEFLGNVAVSGGAGMDDENTSAYVESSVFTGNIVTGPGQIGGAIHSRRASTLTLLNSRISSNQASHGGGVANDASSLDVNNCNLTHNLATDGSGTGAAILSREAPFVLSNSIVWYNLPALGSLGGDPLHVPAVTYCDVEGGCTAPASCTTDDTGNFAAEPAFLEPVSDQRLLPESPCIDAAGESALPADCVGVERVDVPGVGHEGASFADVGVYEWQP
ncbi:MAG: right-handed parallel beta-helix repeat-containing protein [Polyangiaceae bacterium]|nr:right-handed parallel beta-helix repeat-containing protein [Polyangiaceae bacterium]